jgi:NADPH-dependent ferric siderophore reductase
MRDDLPTMGEDLRVHLRHDHGTEEITVDLVVTPHEGESVGSPWARWW